MTSQLYRYKLLISYDGSNYSGWQVQPNALSIQEVLEKAFFTLFHSPIKVIGSGRTDAGVHALGQVAHVSLDHLIMDEEKLLYSLNGILPHDIRIKSFHPTSPHFHARFDAKRKVYHYHLHCELFQDPSKRFYSYHVRYKLDIETLKKAISYFVGTHNFKAFANENTKGSAKHSPIKTIYAIHLVEERGGYRLEFEGSGFLYKMVRNIVGTLLECASGKLPPEEIPALFSSEDRRAIARSAPAHGLFLVRVDYE
jgi:tRNA pseudouridine38-40 synthase